MSYYDNVLSPGGQIALSGFFVGDVPVYFGIDIPIIPVAVVCKYDISPTGDLSVRYRKFRFGSQIHRGFINYKLH